MPEEVIELSIEETNKLRAELGLKPLRVDDNTTTAKSSTATTATAVREGQDEILEMSVDDTNKLREQLGLPPLRSSTKAKEVVFQATENVGEQEEAAKRIEQAKLKREVEEGVSQVFGSSTLASEDGEDDATLSWADKMRKQKATITAKTVEDKKKKKTKTTPKAGDYGASDLEGLQVRNSMADLEAGSNTVLTLADTSILETKTSVSSKVVGLNQEEDALENVNLTEREKQQDGLRKKRMLEMGMGRAGGYAGFDDEEFEELGGTLGPSRQERGGAAHLTSGGDDYEESEGGGASKRRGFRIGSEKEALANAVMSDFDKVQQGKAVSLVGKSDVAASDYMTVEEEEEEREKRRKKDAKFKKKKKKKDKKRRRKTVAEDEEEEEEEEQPIARPASGSSLLAQLEQSAPAEESSGLKKRRRSEDMEEDEGPGAAAANAAVPSTNGQPRSKRAKYDEIMEKGNLRTKLAFGGETKPVVKQEVPPAMEEEADDSFLNAALAKARRLNRLRAMNNGSSAKGAEAVVEAVKATAVEEKGPEQSSGTMSFSVDDTREFSRALRARTEQKKRETEKQNQDSSKIKVSIPIKKEVAEDKGVKFEDVEEDEDVDMEELAKEVKPDAIEPAGLEGTTASSAGVGRGLSSFVNMLKTTGEITGKHGGKEELRGRAKDERNYDNYEPLDLKKVVTIGKNATDKDKEFATREIKLEYRDKHGRLLTQKEAFRDLCYQFHGHGASKKKEEKRLKQIAREQAEARLASRQVSAARDGTAAGTLGALKATQKATGKAFVVHKT